MHLALAVPEHQFDRSLGGHPRTQIAVGQENDLVDAELGSHRIDHVHGVGRRAAGIGFGLHRGAGIDIADHRHARVLRTQRTHIFGRDR